MDKPNDESIKVDKRGKGTADHFTNEHHRLVFHKDGKVDETNTRYDACKFKQNLQNYSKPIEPDCLFECLPSNLRPLDIENIGEKSHDLHQSLENSIFTISPIIIAMVVPLLHDLAQQMIQAGHQQEIFETYRDTRGAVLEQSLQRLGVERLTTDDVNKMNWEVLQAKIEKWIHYMPISVKQLFATEKKICDQILDGVESLRDQSFAGLTANSFGALISFGEAIAKSKRSPEKLFALIDMFETMTELMPEFDLIFGSQPCTEMKESTLNLTKLLAETAHEIFADIFEEAVKKDETKRIVVDGSVHPLTSYVVNYVKYLFVVSRHGNTYQSTLRLIFKEFGNVEDLKSVVVRIIQALLNNLDGKSKQYKDAALTQLFLMNNVHYIVRSIRRSEAKDLLGDDWVQIHRKIVQQYAKEYKRVSWEKILQCLTAQPSGSDPIKNSNISVASVKDRFKTFNSQFEELHQRQCRWTVPDSELRKSLRLSVAEVLVPAFISFLKRFGPMIESGKNPQKYIRFTPEDFERMLNEFLGQDLE
ncbi:exocyst complex component EXO70A1 [Eutrema salsugineum]|uniref:exocyst complex component EXO70A1 n=1 Tax=Eutrema salsugineum TaxID=72664 RepID=UPI000CED71D2|nr:exocyst complex component EXO70A1 [Eutrema salsugineum]